MNAIVRLRGVEKAYGALAAVRDMNLEVEEGEFLTLLGPSGCGKTTTLRLVSGFETPDRGTIEIAGQDVTRAPPFRRNVNTVFQSYALFPHLSVFDNVAYGLVVKRRPRVDVRRRVHDMLERMDLMDKAARMPDQLSGGQMQRVALARALVNEPSVLLLDEPLGALDAKLRRQMQVELKAMHQRLGTTFVYVTHDQEEAMVMSDRVVVMDRAVVQQVGGPSQIYAAPANRFVAGFLGSANFVPARVRSLADGGAVLQVGDAEIRCRAASGLAAGQAAVLFIRPEQLAAGPLAAAAAPNALIGRLVDSVHLGALRRLTFALNGGTHVAVDVLADAPAGAGAAPGTLWQLPVPPAAAIAFPADADDGGETPQ